MWDKELKIKQVDSLLKGIKPARRFKSPKKGWIQLLRTSLGMSTRVLGERCGLSQSRISLIEKGEVDGTITLNTLEKVAEGLDCELVYFLVPKQDQTLEGLRERQAEKKARHLNHYTEIQMSLEQQPTSDAFQNTTQDKIKSDLLEKWPRDFWDEK
ncbi:mobile mystery protein A [Ewingella americana]|jgi:predicted DNA-binding mobile mystery protein A